MKIFLDDERNPRQGEDDWTIVRSVEALNVALARHGNKITHLSLDHDLGRRLSGSDAVNTIAGHAFAEPFRLPALEKITVHSANTAAARSMLDKLQGSRGNGGLSKSVCITYDPARDDTYPLAAYDTGRNLPEIKPACPTAAHMAMTQSMER